MSSEGKLSKPTFWFLVFKIEPEQRSAEAKPATEGKTPEQIQGPEMEEKAVQELKSLSKDLQALRLHVEQHFGGSQSSEEWMQVGFIIDRLLFCLYIFFITVSVITIIIMWYNSY